VAETPRSLATYGLDTPLRLTIHTGKDKEPPPARTLLVGRNDQVKKGVYAMREGRVERAAPARGRRDGDPAHGGRAARQARPRRSTAIRSCAFDLESPKGGRHARAREGSAGRSRRRRRLPADQVEAGALLDAGCASCARRDFLSDDASAVPRVLAKPTVKLTAHRAGQAADHGVARAVGRAPRQRAERLRRRRRPRGPSCWWTAKALDDLGRSVGRPPGITRSSPDSSPRTSSGCA